MAYRLTILKDEVIDVCCWLDFQELRSQLETCLTEGTPLVIMDCDATALAHDQRFTRLLRGRLAFMNAKTPFKMMVSLYQTSLSLV